MALDINYSEDISDISISFSAGRRKNRLVIMLFSLGINAGGISVNTMKQTCVPMWPSPNLSSKSSGPPHQTGSRQNM